MGDEVKSAQRFWGNDDVNDSRATGPSAGGSGFLAPVFATPLSSAAGSAEGALSEGHRGREAIYNSGFPSNQANPEL